MRALRWLSAALLIVSIAYGGRELLAVSRLAPGGAPAAPAQALTPAAATLAAAETGSLDLASKIASLDASGPADASAPAAAAAPAPRPEHAEAADTNSAPGKIIAAKGGRGRTAIPGGAVITDANGDRLELVPASRPKPSVSSGAVAALSKVELPSLDDPRASLASRKRRAEGALLACALAAVALAYWARRYR